MGIAEPWVSKTLSLKFNSGSIHRKRRLFIDIKFRTVTRIVSLIDSLKLPKAPWGNKCLFVCPRFSILDEVFTKLSDLTDAWNGMFPVLTNFAESSAQSLIWRNLFRHQLLSLLSKCFRINNRNSSSECSARFPALIEMAKNSTFCLSLQSFWTWLITWVLLNCHDAGRWTPDTFCFGFLHLTESKVWILCYECSLLQNCWRVRSLW